MKPSRISIVVDSRYGSTLSLAKAIAEGAASEQAEVRLLRVELSEPEFSDAVVIEGVEGVFQCDVHLLKLLIFLRNRLLGDA